MQNFSNSKIPTLNIQLICENLDFCEIVENRESSEAPDLFSSPNSKIPKFRYLLTLSFIV